jgi:hypothetical protein
MLHPKMKKLFIGVDVHKRTHTAVIINSFFVFIKCNIGIFYITLHLLIEILFKFSDINCLYQKYNKEG